MQEPLLRANIPYPTSDHQSPRIHTVPISGWTYPYSFYLSITLYLLIICVFYIARITIGMLDFFVENGGMITGEILLVITAFFPIWGIIFLSTRLILFFLMKRSTTRDARLWQKSIVIHLAHTYCIVASVVTLAVTMIDCFVVHHWHGISLLIGMFLLFLFALYAPLLRYKIWLTHQARSIGTSFAELKPYFPPEERARHK